MISALPLAFLERAAARLVPVEAGEMRSGPPSSRWLSRSSSGRAAALRLLLRHREHREMSNADHDRRRYATRPARNRVSLRRHTITPRADIDWEALCKRVARIVWGKLTSETPIVARHIKRRRSTIGKAVRLMVKESAAGRGPRFAPWNVFCPCPVVSPIAPQRAAATLDSIINKLGAPKSMRSRHGAGPEEDAAQ
jgi:hypothetical protein